MLSNAMGAAGEAAGEGRGEKAGGLGDTAILEFEDGEPGAGGAGDPTVREGGPSF